MVMRRLLQRDVVNDYFQVERNDILSDYDKQYKLFYRVFPRQIDIGEKKPTTFDWMLSRTADGQGHTAPRELIHLLNEAVKRQVTALEIGEGNPEGESLFARQIIKESLPAVSKARLEQTLYAEHPTAKDWIEALREVKATQNVISLSRLWSVSADEAIKRAERLVEYGFFERREFKGQPEYWVPFLYRDALDLVQGRADS
jgi:hypothetical protein